MKYKRRIIFLYLIVAYLLITIAINLGINSITNWYGLIIGLSLMIIAIPFHQSGKVNNIGYIVSYILNSIGVGFSISTYYTKFNITPDQNTMFTAAVIGFMIVLAFGLITYPKRVKPHVKAIAALIITALFITSLILWIQNDAVIFGILFFYLQIAYFYMIGMITSSNNIDDLSREMSKVSFSAFVVISFVVLIIISEGEALEGIDGLGVLAGNGKKDKTHI